MRNGREREQVQGTACKLTTALREVDGLSCGGTSSEKLGEATASLNSSPGKGERRFHSPTPIYWLRVDFMEFHLSCASWSHGWWWRKSIQTSGLSGNKVNVWRDLRGVLHGARARRCQLEGQGTAMVAGAARAVPAGRPGSCVHRG